MKVTFGATHIKPTNILKKNGDKYVSHKVSVVELNRNDKNDLITLGTLESDWGCDSLVNFILAVVENNSRNHIYALTSQEDSFENLDDKKVLGVMLFEEQEAENELKAIQTHPRYKTKKCHRPNYKNIGTAMIDFLKEKYSDKPLVLYSDSSALGFYEKLGFKDDIAGTNWKVWNA